MKKNYKNIFFDLDRTLWDFEANTKISIHDSYQKFNLETMGVSNFDEFYDRYSKHNLYLWDAYKNNIITKEELKVKRFRCVLAEYGIFDEEIAQGLSRFYIDISGTKTLLIPGAKEILEYLKGRYRMFIITNGFEEVQFKKIKLSNLEQYFDDVITSDEAGTKKPDHRIFLYSLTKTGSKPTESIMIGDEVEADVIPARTCGMDQIFFNPKDIVTEEATYSIKELREIFSIL